MQKYFLALAFGAIMSTAVSAQSVWTDVPEYTTYTDETNPVVPGGNNMLQGANFRAYIMNDSWATLATEGSAAVSYDGNQFTTGKITYTAPQGRGNNQWTAQLCFETNYSMDPSKKYDLTFHVKSSAANKFTVKIEDTVDPNNKNMGYTYVTLPANQELLFVLHNASPEMGIDEVKLMFDAGGAAVGSTIEIYDIVLQSADELGQQTGGPRELTAAPEGFVLVWEDNFDENSLGSKWNEMNWNSGHVNNEKQNYRPGSQAITAADGSTMHTAEIKDGKLVITCFKGADGKIYSGRMDSHDASANHSGYAAWRYGYMEARIKLPAGRGTWPAFWMMPEGVNWSDENWPRCGEIDIMEEVGSDPNQCVCSLHAEGHYHANGTQVSASKHVDNMEGGWITYAMLWDNDNISMYANGQRILSYNNDHRGFVNWPYDRPYYITLNLAWGGDWGGAKGTDESVLPVSMEVDYVRVYQLPDKGATGADGSGRVYIHGPYNGVAKDGVVPSSTFNSWVDNYFAIEGKDKVYTKTFIVGRSLHATRGRFQFCTDASGSQAFTPEGSEYRISMEPNDYLQMDANGMITPKSDARLRNNDELTLTLDLSKGVSKGVLRVNWKEGEPEKKDYYLIGAKNSIWPDFIGTNDDGWDWKYCYKLEQDGYRHSHTFTVGEDIDPRWVNFKFMPQNSWSGGQFGSNDEWKGYTISYDGDFFVLGRGQSVNGIDNGNINLAPGKTLEGIDKLTVTLDVTDGEEHAKFYSNLDAAGIESVTIDGDDADAPWFDLFGRRIERPLTPGIYIHGHKKVLVRPGM